MPEPLAALEDALAPAVERTPCIVAFSGGRDSSLVLAAAIRAARRRGAPPPVAATLVYPDVPEADESEWQEQVLRDLGVQDWHRIEVMDELDMVGPVATRQLQRHGVLHPANAHSLGPLLEAAAGGPLVLGVGGDELLTGNRWTKLNNAIARRRSLQPRDALRLAHAAMPPPLRARLVRRREPPPDELGWLRPEANSARTRLMLRHPREPVRWSRAVHEAASARGLRLAVDSLELLGRDVGVEVACPFAEPGFVASLAKAGGATGWGDRTAAMRAIAGDTLPDTVLTRRTKATFNGVFFGPHTRAFAESWSGEGVDTRLVDPEALRREWTSEQPDYRSGLSLQAAWLHDHARKSGRDGERAAA